MGRKIERFEKIIEKIKKSYSIENKDIGLYVTKLSGSAKARWSLVRGYYLVIDYEKTSRMDNKELTGLLAHEMAHIKQLTGFSFLKKITEMMMVFIAGKSNKFYLKQKNNIKTIEREADKFAIDNGFGKELLAFKIWCEKNYSKEKLITFKELYMSSKEIRKELGK